MRNEDIRLHQIVAYPAETPKGFAFGQVVRLPYKKNPSVGVRTIEGVPQDFMADSLQSFLDQASAYFSGTTSV